MKITKTLLEQMIRESMALKESEAYERAMQVQAPPKLLSRSRLGLEGALSKINRFGLPSPEQLDSLRKKSPEELATFNLTHDDLDMIEDFGYSQLLEPEPIDAVGLTAAAADGPILPFGDVGGVIASTVARGQKVKDMLDIANIVKDTAAIQQADQDTSDTGDK